MRFRFRHVIAVWQKELLDTVRDRRAILMTFVVPLVIMPLFVLGPSYLRHSQATEELQAMQAIVLQNGDEAPDLRAALEIGSGLRAVEIADPQIALREGRISLWVIVPPGFTARLAHEEPASLEVRFDQTKSDSRTAREKFAALLSRYRNGLVEQRLQARGVAPEILQPFAVSYQSVATQEQVGGFMLSLILPLFFILWASIGGVQTAMDVTVGEKERKTLEALLVTPLRRESLVLGKVLAIFSVTLLAAIISLIGFVFSLQFGASLLGSGELRNMPLADLRLAFSPLRALLLLTISAGVAAMMGALTFALFSWTRSLREAQSHTAWLTFAVMIPALVVQFREFTPSLGTLLIPIFNATLVFKELLLGQLNWLHIAVTMASLLIYALISIGMATRVFRDERVLFRQ